MQKAPFTKVLPLLSFFHLFAYLEQIGPLLVRDVLDVVQVDLRQLGVIVAGLLDHLVNVCTVGSLLWKHLVRGENLMNC